MKIVNGLPHSDKRRQLNGIHDIEIARANNQFVLKGTDPEFVLAANSDKTNPIVFLEYVYATASTTFTIKDVDGNTIAAGLPEVFGDARGPIRLDWGVKLVGSILFAKGFYIE